MSDAAPAPQLPLFYTNPVPIELARHGSWKIKQKRSFAFSAGTNALPIVIDEFPALALHYPLVFTGGDSSAALALVGLRQGENLFVGADGAWAAGMPVPAYVRRYPFIFVEVPQDQRMILCIEEDAAVIGPDGDAPLFDGEKASAAGNEALEFCSAFNTAAQQTQLFCDELRKHNLLIEQRADIVTPGNQRISLSGFSVIDEQKFNALPDDVYMEWRKRNWIGLVYAHLLSLGRWNALVDLTSARA